LSAPFLSRSRGLIVPVAVASALARAPGQDARALTLRSTTILALVVLAVALTAERS